MVGEEKMMDRLREFWGVMEVFWILGMVVIWKGYVLKFIELNIKQIWFYCIIIKEELYWKNELITLKAKLWVNIYTPSPPPNEFITFKANLCIII